MWLASLGTAHLYLTSPVLLFDMDTLVDVVPVPRCSTTNGNIFLAVKFCVSIFDDNLGPNSMPLSQHTLITGKEMNEFLRRSIIFHEMKLNGIIY